jgi:hypothetical protein
VGSFMPIERRMVMALGTSGAELMLAKIEGSMVMFVGFTLMLEFLAFLDPYTTASLSRY